MSVLRYGTVVSEAEKTYIQQRQAKIQAALFKLYDRKINKIPRIAVVGSGGGYRSMISLLGCLSGLEKLGVFDLLMYISALSGSTWLLSNLYSSNDSLNILTEKLKSAVSKTLVDKPINWYNIFAILEKQEDITAVDLWGLFLANRLIPGKSATTLSQLKVNSQRPLPLFNCINPVKDKYNWLTFNPFEVGYVTADGPYVNTHFLGSRFEDGKCVEKKDEIPLSLLMGIFGSAFAVDPDELLLMFDTDIALAIKTILDWYGCGEYRLSEGCINNFANKAVSPNNEEDLLLVDAGIDYNLALPAYIGREIDIYIFCDASADTHNDLKKSLAEAEAMGLDLPSIDSSRVPLDKVSIFTEDGKPLVIYCPNPIKDSTFKLSYSSEEFDELYTGNYKIVVDAATEILTAIENKL